MSGSVIPRIEYLKITATSNNMHRTGNEKMSDTQPIRELLAAERDVCTGESEAVDNKYLLLSHCDSV